MTAENVAQFFQYADGCIVGFGMKEAGHPEQPVELNKVRRFMDAVESTRKNGKSNLPGVGRHQPGFQSAQ